MFLFSLHNARIFRRLLPRAQQLQIFVAEVIYIARASEMKTRRRRKWIDAESVS